MTSYKQPRIISKFDGKEYVPGVWFNRHLKEHNINSIPEYFEHFQDLKDSIPDCPYCDKKKKVLKYFPVQTIDCCGDKECKKKAIQAGHLNRSDDAIIKSSKKRKETVMEKYGTEYITQTETHKNKVKETMEEVDNSGKTKRELNIEAIQKSKEDSHGNKFYNNSKQISKTKRSFTSEKKEEIVNRTRKTNMERYGVENVLMLDWIQQKVNSENGRFKEYKLPSGNLIYIRGYEDRAITKLLETYTEDEMCIPDGKKTLNGVPVFEYTAESGNKLKYYPDIFIPKDNLIIEVKSRWWYDADNRPGYENRVKNNHHKRDVVISEGYKFQFWIYEQDNTLVII